MIGTGPAAAGGRARRAQRVQCKGPPVDPAALWQRSDGVS